MRIEHCILIIQVHLGSASNYLILERFYLDAVAQCCLGYD